MPPAGAYFGAPKSLSPILPPPLPTQVAAWSFTRAPRAALDSKWALGVYLAPFRPQKPRGWLDASLRHKNQLQNTITITEKRLAARRALLTQKRPLVVPTATATTPYRVGRSGRPWEREERVGVERSEVLGFCGGFSNETARSKTSERSLGRQMFAGGREEMSKPEREIDLSVWPLHFQVHALEFGLHFTITDVKRLGAVVEKSDNVRRGASCFQHDAPPAHIIPDAAMLSEQRGNRSGVGRIGTARSSCHGPCRQRALRFNGQ